MKGIKGKAMKLMAACAMLAITVLPCATVTSCANGLPSATSAQLGAAALKWGGYIDTLALGVVNKKLVKDGLPPLVPPSATLTQPEVAPVITPSIGAPPKFDQTKIAVTVPSPTGAVVAPAAESVDSTSPGKVSSTQ